MSVFNKTFKLTIYALIIAEFLSFGNYLFPGWRLWVFLGILTISLIVSLKKLEYGLYILLAELFIGGKGYLFAFDFAGITISIRIALFTILLAVWIFKKIKSKNYSLPITHLSSVVPMAIGTKGDYPLLIYSALLLAIFYATINGLVKNQLSAVFFDANAWLFFLLLPIFVTVIKSKEQLRPVLQILLAAATWLAVKTIIVLYLFSHEIVEVGDIFYKWLRDTGVGEITYIDGTLFRVFFQSHLYVLIGGLIVLAFIFAKKIKCGGSDIPHSDTICHTKRETKATFANVAFGLGTILYLASLTLLISQSRSFWVGGVAGLAFLVAIAIWKLKWQWYEAGALIALLALVIFSQLSVINIITGNYAGNLITYRLTETAASSSRLNQLAPLAAAIFKHPIFGSGFGTEVTYKSNDPRILAAQPEGWYTTYAFEWGYLDIWLKLGLIGIVIYLAFIGKVFLAGFKNFNPVNLALLTGIVALCTVNIFSPYLNHPLGIGFIMLAMTSVYNSSPTEKNSEFHS